MKVTEERKKQMKEYREKNKDILTEHKKKYYSENKDYIKNKTKEYQKIHSKEIKSFMKTYWEDNKDILKPINALRNRDAYAKRDVIKYRQNKNIWEKNKIKNDSKFAIKKRLRQRLNQALNIYSNNGKIKNSNDYGINYETIMKYLGPCPGNRSLYHIDHITPLYSFDFNNPEQIRKAFAPKNHQWLTIEEHKIKTAKDIIVYRN